MQNKQYFITENTVTTALTRHFGFVTNTAVCFTLFFSFPKIAFYKTLVFITQKEEMLVLFENAYDLQAPYMLTK